MPTDTERLDFLQALNDQKKYTGRVVLRDSRTGRGLKDGEPCRHPSCLSHISHPCEGCGRIAGAEMLPGLTLNCDAIQIDERRKQ